jgi:hypothetical protein
LSAGRLRRIIVSSRFRRGASPGSGHDSAIVVEKPTYVTINLETTVNRPAAEV